MSFQDKLTYKINEITKTTHEIVEDWVLEQLSNTMMKLNNGVLCRKVTLREIPMGIDRYEILQIANGLDPRIVCLEEYDGGAWTGMGRGESYFMIYCSRNSDNKYLTSLRQEM
jgi:hypothetical protein